MSPATHNVTAWWSWHFDTLFCHSHCVRYNKVIHHLQRPNFNQLIHRFKLLDFKRNFVLSQSTWPHVHYRHFQIIKKPMPEFPKLCLSWVKYMEWSQLTSNILPICSIYEFELCVGWFHVRFHDLESSIVCEINWKLFDFVDNWKMVDIFFAGWCRLIYGFEWEWK